MLHKIIDCQNSQKRKEAEENKEVRNALFTSKFKITTILCIKWQRILPNNEFLISILYTYVLGYTLAKTMDED